MSLSDTRLPLIKVNDNKKFNELVEEFIYTLYDKKIRYSPIILSCMIFENILNYGLKKVVDKYQEKCKYCSNNKMFKLNEINLGKLYGINLLNKIYSIKTIKNNRIITEESKNAVEKIFKHTRNPIAHGT